MPKSTPTPRQFADLAQRRDAKWVQIFKPNDNFTKFKLRTSSHVYTVTVKDQFAQMIIDAMPAELDVQYIEKKTKSTRAANDSDPTPLVE
jgi:hypothetical protein